MPSDPKAGLKLLGWTAVLTLVAVGVFLVAMSAGLPQMPTVGFILVGLVAAAIVLGVLQQATVVRTSNLSKRILSARSEPCA